MLYEWNTAESHMLDESMGVLGIKFAQSTNSRSIEREQDRSASPAISQSMQLTDQDDQARTDPARHGSPAATLQPTRASTQYQLQRRLNRPDTTSVRVTQQYTKSQHATNADLSRSMHAGSGEQLSQVPRATMKHDVKRMVQRMHDSIEKF